MHLAARGINSSSHFPLGLPNTLAYSMESKFKISTCQVFGSGYIRLKWAISSAENLLGSFMRSIVSSTLFPCEA
ncbi:hypothetical protein BpHYR1_047417 [Brachionus plicatilis]|uniref:Uncharacterized protein n=1 Tax=Brachionus plicatilis TaxID=10195 RepID=A0A3M7T1M8_BRAPC|nr:hypothetical protein BpHYR1_047417 [Brachionus plicatilis]